MKKIRIIPRLDIKGPNVVKGIHLEGLRVVGKPAELAHKYYQQGADEILYIDIVASLYERNNLSEIVKEAISLGVFVPMTVGGGVRSIEDIRKLLHAGADKVAINTAATKNPELITKAAKIFGAQCIVGSIEAKKTGENKWEAYTDNGREKTNLDAVEWAQKLVELGAGELLVTSVDNEGVQKGYDIDLIREISSRVNVPVIASGGAGNSDDVKECLEKTECSAASMAAILHYNETTITEIKQTLKENNLPVRYIQDNEVIDETKKEKIISIVDYGVGNIMSVISGFKKVGCNVNIVSTPEEIEKATSLVLPGVGAFKDGMRGLEERGLIPAIKKYIEEGKPILGICLGAQLLMTKSEEFGEHTGLNIVEGTVTKFSEDTKEKYCIPHINWNTLTKPKEDSWEKTILSKTQEKTQAYFIHSYYITPKDENMVIAKTTYAEQEFCSAFKKGNVYGCQFHPEKSGTHGLKIIEEFAKL